MDISTAKQLGDLGEKLACEYLVKKGFNILERNYRISFGEIDIVAQKKRRLFIPQAKTIHFVEVKTIFHNQDFFPEEKVDGKKQKKLASLCQLWLQKNNFRQDWPHQIDVIGISLDKNTHESTISYFENVVEGTSFLYN